MTNGKWIKSFKILMTSFMNQLLINRNILKGQCRYSTPGMKLFSRQLFWPI